jgi:uncharacterized protein with HEPN domain
METDDKKFLFDIAQAVKDVQAFTAELLFDGYAKNRLVKAAVERKFEIMGEALNRLHKITPETAEAVRNYKKIISFRNILIHGYDVVSDPIVWDIIQNSLPELLEDVENLLLA